MPIWDMAMSLGGLIFCTSHCPKKTPWPSVTRSISTRTYKGTYTAVTYCLYTRVKRMAERQPITGYGVGLDSNGDRFSTRQKVVASKLCSGHQRLPPAWCRSFKDHLSSLLIQTNAHVYRLLLQWPLLFEPFNGQLEANHLLQHETEQTIIWLTDFMLVIVVA